MDKLKKIKKYSKFFLKMISHSVKLIQCNKEKCKKEFNKQEKYKDVINEKISKLSKKEESTELFKTFYKKREIIRESYNTNKDVKQYLDNLKKNIENDVKITLSYKREFKKFIRNMKKNRIEYYKTSEKKQYEQERKKILKEITDNNKYIELAKCSFDNCLKLHNEDLMLIKKLTTKLCNEKMKKSCKIATVLNKLVLKKLNYDDKIKVLKLIKKGIM